MPAIGNVFDNHFPLGLSLTAIIFLFMWNPIIKTALTPSSLIHSLMKMSYLDQSCFIFYNVVRFNNSKCPLTGLLFWAIDQLLSLYSLLFPLVYIIIFIFDKTHLENPMKTDTGFETLFVSPPLLSTRRIGRNINKLKIVLRMPKTKGLEHLYSYIR